MNCQGLAKYVRSNEFLLYRRSFPYTLLSIYFTRFTLQIPVQGLKGNEINFFTYTSFKVDVAVENFTWYLWVRFFRCCQISIPLFFLLFFAILIVVLINFFTLKT